MFSITERETEKLIGVKRFNFDIINLFKAVIFNTYLFINSIDDEFNDDTNDEFNDDIDNSYVNEEYDEEDDEEDDGEDDEEDDNIRDGHYVNPRRNRTNKIFDEDYYNDQRYEYEEEERKMERKRLYKKQILHQVKKPHSLHSGKTFILLKDKLFVCEDDFGVLKVSSVDSLLSAKQNEEQPINEEIEDEQFESQFEEQNKTSIHFIQTNQEHITLKCFDYVYRLFLDEKQHCILSCFTDFGDEISRTEIIV